MGTHPIFESDFDCLTEIMAKGNEKRFNKKSRTQNIETEISDNQAVVENTVDGYGTEGASNALVIQKKKVVLKNQKPQERRKLSKKKRKQLERLLDQKDKKEKRGELLERLSQLQVPTTELEKYSSIAHLGTNHTHKALSKLPDKNFNGKINTVKGKNRKWQVIEEDEPSQAVPESSSDESEMEELSEDLPAPKIEMKADSEENVLQPGVENPNKK